MSRKRPRTWLTLIVLSLILITVLLIIAYFWNGANRNREPGKTKDAVNEILQKMSLEEKVGQVIVAYFTGPEFGSAPAEELRELPLGVVILFSSAGNIESPAQVAGLTEQIQQAALDSGIVPLFIAVDQEGGAVARLTEGVTVFPGNMALGATGGEDWPA